MYVLMARKCESDGSTVVCETAVHSCPHLVQLRRYLHKRWLLTPTLTPEDLHAGPVYVGNTWAGEQLWARWVS